MSEQRPQVEDPKPEETALAQVEPPRQVLMTAENRDVIQAIAYDYFASGKGYLPKHIESEEQAKVIMYYGYEIGLPPMASLQEIYVVHGRPGLQSKAMLALLRGRPDLGYPLWGECNDTEANLTLYVRTPDQGYVAQDFRWTVEDSKRAGIYSDMHKKYPRTMNRNRVVSEGMRATFPDLLLGCAYTPEELGAPMMVVAGEDLEVDQQALAGGVVVEPDEAAGSRYRALAEAGLDEEDGETNFDETPTAGQLDTEPNPEAVARSEVQTVVGTVMDPLLPPQDGPEAWATDADPSTKKQALDLLTQIGLSPGHAKAIGARAADEGANGAKAVWDTVAGWWFNGLLPARLYEALLDAAEIPRPEKNPFTSTEEADAEPEEEEDAFGDDDSEDEEE